MRDKSLKRVVCLLTTLAVPAFALETEKPDEAAELAKQLANPVAALISVPFQVNYDKGMGPDGEGSKSLLNIQPVTPFSLGGNWNLVLRTIVPVASQEDVVPGDEDVLLKAVRNAMAENELRNKEAAAHEAVRARMRTLTERELEVMRHVISGELNKQIGNRLGVVEKTIKVHRARVMEKMGVLSVAELVRLCSLAGVEPAEK